MNDPRLQGRDPKIKANDSNTSNDYVYLGYLLPSDKLSEEITIVKISDSNEKFFLVGFGLWKDREIIDYSL